MKKKKENQINKINKKIIKKGAKCPKWLKPHTASENKKEGTICGKNYADKKRKEREKRKGKRRRNNDIFISRYQGNYSYPFC